MNRAKRAESTGGKAKEKRRGYIAECGHQRAEGRGQREREREQRVGAGSRGQRSRA
jgi:hypothetical protein